jgi:hypothetical protein
MTKYESLHTKFLSWNAMHDQCGEKATIGMINFFNGLRAFLDAPEDSMRLCRVDPDLDGPGKYTAEGFGKALTQTDTSSWRFGIEIIFGSDGGIEMRKVDDIQFSISLRGSVHLFFDICIGMQEGGSVFSNALDNSSPRATCKFEDTIASMASFYDYMTGLLDRVFETKPWDGPKKIPIGFESTRGA